MTAIRVVCRSCGSEVNSAEVDREMRCVTCAARQLVQADMDELVRLFRKQRRYARRGCTVNAAQIDRVRLRINQKLHRRLPAEAIVGDDGLDARLMQEARQRADSSGGRILVPRVGQEIVGAGARA